jgi:hypothetical protein
MALIRTGIWMSVVVCMMFIMLPKRQRRRYSRALNRALRRFD